MQLTGWKIPALAIVCVGLGAAGSVVAGGTPAKYSVSTPDTIKFSPVDPKNPKGIQISVLSGDPTTGPVAFELKLPKGAVPLHYHSSDYYAMVVDGKQKHWLAAEDGTKAKPLGVGSFWFQPGGDKNVHGDECITDTCTLYITMPGKFDMTVAPAAKK